MVLPLRREHVIEFPILHSHLGLDRTPSNPQPTFIPSTLTLPRVAAARHWEYCMQQDRNRGAIDAPFAVPFVHRLRFTDDVLGADRQVLADVLAPSEGRPARVQFWADQHVLEAQEGLRERLRQFADSFEHIQPAGNVQVVPGGEEIKNDIHILERMLKVFNAANLDRRSYVVVIGGGAVLDAVGFATAIAHRGLRLVRLPTTTLGQADSGVGVKNGVNLFQKKNWLGAFATPWAVVNDARLLDTLSDRDWVCGFSEAVKVALLKDAAWFDRLCHDAQRIGRRDLSAGLPAIRTSAQWHLKHITEGGDPFEMLEARPLDYGHWSAHKLEPMTDFELRHGEAVTAEKLAGMYLELQRRGAHNLNLVTPSHVNLQWFEALFIAAQNGFSLPVVYNCGGYARVEVLRIFEGVIDVYMPDAKYRDAKLAAELSDAKDYPKVNQAALIEMHRQAGPLVTDAAGIAVRGMLVRHLMLPGKLENTLAVLDDIAAISPDIPVSLMTQYFPAYKAPDTPGMNERVTKAEYRAAEKRCRELGLINGYFQRL